MPELWIGTERGAVEHGAGGDAAGLHQGLDGRRVVLAGPGRQQRVERRLVVAACGRRREADIVGQFGTLDRVA